MNSLEIAPQAENRAASGMTHQQNVEAKDVYSNYKRLVGTHNIREDLRHREPHVTDTWVDGYLERRKIKKVKKQGEKLYNASSDAYHEQAVKEAEAAGHEIAFSGAVAKTVKVKYG